MSEAPKKRGRPKGSKNTKKKTTDKEKIPKKRGRKPKVKNENDIIKKPKKRGRKPKGGKILKKEDLIADIQNNLQQNIILQLKCNSNDLNNYVTNMSEGINYTPSISDPEAFNFNNKSNLEFKELKNNKVKNEYASSNTNQPFLNANKKIEWTTPIKQEEKVEQKEEEVTTKVLWDKLNQLRKNLRYNNVSDKRSSCFWCTYPFDNPAIHIPREINNETISVYGCFCSPECAVAYLKKEHIDTSTKWERYAMLNNIYGKIYDYEKNIKPAPEPYYILDKYYGNMSIGEYRKLLEHNTLFMVVDKPMTKVLPELCEENNEYPDVNNNMLTSKTNTSTTSKYRLKRNTAKKSKQDYLINNFTNIKN